MTKGARRSQLEIFHDILAACYKHSHRSFLLGEKEMLNISKVQLSCGMAYDILKKKIKELESRNLLTLTPVMSITSLGIKFMKQSKIIMESIDSLAISLDSEADNKNNFDIKDMARLPVNYAHKARDSKQVIIVQKAIILRLEN